jgi:hypothetical protein
VIHFPLEPRDLAGRLTEEIFQRHRADEAEVLRLADDAHAPAGYLGANAIAATHGLRACVDRRGVARVGRQGSGVGIDSWVIERGHGVC